jgi:hypothetical protein
MKNTLCGSNILLHKPVILNLVAKGKRMATEADQTVFFVKTNGARIVLSDA